MAVRDATNREKSRWMAAGRWRRRVERALDGSGLTFREWLVLDATHFLIAETGEAVSQSQVAANLELDRQALSEVMRPLERMQLVSRGPSMSGRAWRVFVTNTAVELLGRHSERIEAASEGWD